MMHSASNLKSEVYTTELGFNHRPRFDRRSTTVWWQDTDNLEFYKEIGPYGPNLYKPGDIIYNYNSYGFRCDEFELDSEFPILFLGCSWTEGTGLPIEEIWAYKLLNKIRDKTGLKIPFWNLSLCGTGVDTMAGNLYWFYNKFKINPKYIICLLPALHRREFAYDSTEARSWVVAQPEKYEKHLSPIFSDHRFIEYQSIRSLMLIDSLAKVTNSEVILSFWTIDALVTTGDYLLVDRLFKDFKLMHYPNPEVFNIDAARDSLHHGPSIHSEFANRMWNNFFKSAELT